MEAATYGDIIFFAIMAGFILFKLRSTLGRKPNNDEISRIKKAIESRKEGKIITLDEKGRKEAAQPMVASVKVEKDPDIKDKEIVKKIAEIKKADKSFSAGSFLAGAKAAFEMVLSAFLEGDKTTLKQLLSADVYKDFEKELKKEEKSEKKGETTLVSIVSSNILAVELVKNKASIEVEFISEQIYVVRNKAGKIIKGSVSDINKVKDKWVFERDIRSSNPNWTIVST